MYDYFQSKLLAFLYERNWSLDLRESVYQWPGWPGFNPRSSYTKDLKNNIWYPLA